MKRDQKEAGAEVSTVKPAPGGKFGAMIRKGSEAFGKFREWMWGWFAALVVPAGAFIGFRMLLDWATGFHWGLGAFVAVLYAFIGVLLFRTTFNCIKWRISFEGIVATFFMSVTLSVVVFAWVSFALHTFAHIPYNSTRDLGSVTAFCDLYAWIFIDMIPAVNVWDTLHVPCPIQSVSVVGAIPELMFKIAVVLPLLAAFKLWFDSRKPPETKPESTKSGD
jgi:hypothetical protein